jgi:predicted Zn-dependent peptidase
MIIQNIKKNIPQDRISNGYWGSALQKYVEFGEKYDSEYEQAVNTATPEAVVKAVKKLVDADNFIQLIVSPEK